MRRLRKFLSLPWRDKLLFARAAVLLSTARAALHFASFARVQRWFVAHPVALKSGATRVGQPALERITRAVASAGSAAGAACLPQALVACRMLRSAGFNAEFKVGALKPDALEDLAAHAWVECEGSIVLGGTAGEQYAVLS